MGNTGTKQKSHIPLSVFLASVEAGKAWFCCLEAVPVMPNFAWLRWGKTSRQGKVLSTAPGTVSAYSG